MSTAAQVSLALLYLFLSGCISLSVPLGNKIEKAQNVSYFQLGKHYQEMATKWSDKSWKHTNTANIISFYSECGNDPQLQSMLNEALQALDTYKDKESTAFEINQRQGLRLQTEGIVDGVDVKIDVVVFKKNSCNYTLAHTGRSERLQKTASDFENFLKEFKAP